MHTMTRYRAAATYLLATCVVATAVFLPIYFFWYPGALFDRAGGRELFSLIVGVDLTIGPLLVFIIYKPDKKGLAFDLATIAILQATALGYGVYVLFQSRPVYVVFVKDRFELIRANELEDANLEKATDRRFATLPWTGPRLVGARLPTDRKERHDLMFAAPSGIDVQHFPKYYVDYAEVKPQVLARAEPLSRLRELNPDAAGRIAAMPGRYGVPADQLRFLPMRAGIDVDLAALVDARDAKVLDYVALRPWEYK
jgi:hypothetical protein